MNKSFLLSLSLLLATAHAASAQQPPATAQPRPAPVLSADQQAVRTAVVAFKDALAKGDSTAALALLHDDVLIHEGRIETKTQYRSSHLGADMRAMQGMTIETVREGFSVQGDIALATTVYRRRGTNARGAQVDNTSNEAMVLVRTPSGWLIRNIHWF